MKLKLIEKSVLIALVLAIILSCFDFSLKCEKIRNSVFRLHILANSDSEYDQRLKLKIRDALLEEGLIVFKGSENLEKTVKIAENNLDEFSRIANRVLDENNAKYSASATVTDAYFNTRSYDEFTLPAGVYKALQIKVGKAQGQNWWCVMYPSICISTSSSQKSFEKGEKDIVENKSKYQIRFKIVEWFESLKHYIN